jgi:hypothetical protein
MSEPFESDIPVPHRDRHEHGGMSAHPNDEELALRTERERVEAGLEPYDPEDVPPAADATVPVDPTEDDTFQEIRGMVNRQEFEGEVAPITEEHPFPPTRYEEE